MYTDEYSLWKYLHCPQPMHVLNNFPLTQLTSEVIHWQAICYEVSKRLFHIQGVLEDLLSRSRSARLNTLTRLQRSLVSDRVTAVSKDTTVKLASWLSFILEATRDYIVSDLPMKSCWEVGIFYTIAKDTCSLCPGSGWVLVFAGAVFRAHDYPYQ